MHKPATRRGARAVAMREGFIGGCELEGEGEKRWRIGGVYCSGKSFSLFQAFLYVAVGLGR